MAPKNLCCDKGIKEMDYNLLANIRITFANSQKQFYEVMSPKLGFWIENASA